MRLSRLSPQAIAGVAAAVLACLYVLAATRYRFGSTANPGAGVFPIVVGSGTLVMSVLLLVTEVAGRRGRSSTGPAQHARPQAGWLNRRIIWFAILALLYPAAIGTVGYETATALVLPGMSVVMGERRVVPLAALAILGAAAGYVVFRRWLGVPLP